MTENGFVKECWDGLNIEEFTFSDIEKHIDIQARSGGNCCCEKAICSQHSFVKQSVGYLIVPPNNCIV